MIQITNIQISDERIPKAFDGTRILQVSDLHNRRFGKKQCHLVEKVKEISPDYIFLTGDMIDRNRTNVAYAMDFVREAVKIAPVYSVTGNHELEAGMKGERLISAMTETGVRILHDEIIWLHRNGGKIQVMGIDDPYLLGTQKETGMDRKCSEDFLKRLLALLRRKEPGYIILLSHRPEFYFFYEKAGIPLIFSGHAHGGQFRIPGLGGLVAPHQGILPKYAEGTIYSERSRTTMVVSRGLGNSLFPFRLNNPPELICATLRCGTNRT